MAAVFATKKAKILHELNVPAVQYQDASPKGSVDEGIRELVDKINELDSLVTTSSCAGRVSLYLEGDKSLAIDHAAPTPSAGGKGGGDWLFVSHDPVTQEVGGLETLCPAFSITKLSSLQSRSHGRRFLHFKFEPMVGTCHYYFSISEYDSLPNTDQDSLYEA